MPQYQVPDEAKLGVRMEDGTVYMPDSAGRIHVENQDHVTAIRRNESYRRGVVLEGVRFTNAPGAVRVCCRRSAWGWETHCPSCGAPYGAGAA